MGNKLCPFGGLEFGSDDCNVVGCDEVHFKACASVYESPTAQPYADGECRHPYRVPYRGTEKCTDCGATYNESTLEWEKENAEY